MKKMILELPPNRVRRNYKGGQQLDQLEGNTNPADGIYIPEDGQDMTVLLCTPGKH